MSLANNRRLKHLCVAVASVVYCAGAWAASELDDSAQAKAKLSVVRARIADLANRLGDELEKRDALHARLREAELVITAKRRRLDALRAAEAAAERRRSELRMEQGRDQNALQAERTALTEQVRAAYMIGRQEELKLLLKQSTPASLGRTLAYYGYFARERSDKIDTIQSQMTRLQQLVAQIDQETLQLKTLEIEGNHEVAALERARSDRAAALAARTKLVASGGKVRAPYVGRVVDADWLQGLGLLLIIGHSGGYMTLYGHAEVLYKSVGDWVAPGDVIAALSDSGAAPQLYFEIREGRKTVDPRVLVKANP